MMKNITVIAFDADDTLWVNEPNYQDVEQRFCVLMEEYLSRHNVSQELFKTEMQNLNLYGYGAKSFMLSMVETAIRISDKTISVEAIERIVDYGKELLGKNIELLDGVSEVLEALHKRYQLVVATKGDLLDQERKLKKSGLEKYFHHIEIMSDKQEKDYEKLLRHLNTSADHFVMIGNSLKSDIIPVLTLGGTAIHVPYHTTWAHEKVDNSIVSARLITVNTLTEVLSFFGK